MSKLKDVRHALFDWCCAGTSNLARLIHDCDSALQVALQSSNVDWPEVRRLEDTLNAAHRQENLYWKQRLRIRWLEDGDQNTKIFHQSVARGRKRRRIDTLVDEVGVVHSSEAAKSAHAISYFRSLFSSELHQGLPPLDSLQLFPLITQEMNQALLAPVLPSEIKAATFSIGATQSPGPDGFT
ncbi:hypothetical protein LINPERHAP1_LOCUS10343 [Linum perenne]